MLLEKKHFMVKCIWEIPYTALFVQIQSTKSHTIVKALRSLLVEILPTKSVTIHFQNLLDDGTLLHNVSMFYRTSVGNAGLSSSVIF